jgi:hypothetical protein
LEIGGKSVRVQSNQLEAALRSLGMLSVSDLPFGSVQPMPPMPPFDGDTFVGTPMPPHVRGSHTHRRRPPR